MPRQPIEPPDGAEPTAATVSSYELIAEDYARETEGSRKPGSAYGVRRSRKPSSSSSRRAASRSTGGTTHTRTIAEAFSGHRFAETYDHLAADVEWANIGGPTLKGKNAVVAACEAAAAEMATTTNAFTRFVVAADEDAAAVDVIGTYAGTDGTFVVASCDFYEFRDDRVVHITSYTSLLPTD